jgi:hypothetical protein
MFDFLFGEQSQFLPVSVENTVMKNGRNQGNIDDIIHPNE